MEVKFRPARYEDIAEVAAKMREIDRKELELSSGHSPLEALERSFEQSQYCRCIEVDGTPAALFGVCRPFILSSGGLIWLLGSNDLKKIKKSFVENSIKYIEECFEYAEYLENYVWIENRFSIRWLKWCGFKFDKPRPYGLKKALFLHFYKEKRECANQ